VWPAWFLWTARRRARFVRLRNCPCSEPDPKRARQRAKAYRSPTFRMHTCRCVKRLSSETYRLSRDPNLADRSTFDPLTRENNGPRLGIRTNKGAYGIAREWTRKTRTQIAAKRETGHVRAPQPKRFTASESVDPSPWRCFSVDSRQSSGMDLNASIVIFAIPAIFRRH
jgi:hypothetical protein